MNSATEMCGAHSVADANAEATDAITNEPI